MIQIKRVYAPAAKGDGYRVLIDRLWPRGVKKSDLQFDAWPKEITPSAESRKRFGHKPENFAAFQKEYRAELRSPQARERIDELARRAREQTVTLLYAAHDPQVNHAVVLKDVVERAMA